MPAIPIECVDCPPPSLHLLQAEWNDLFWAAITVGRPNRYYIFRHGEASFYEMIFRASLLRMALTSSAGARRFFRTPLFKSLDPSEKGAINYFLGLTMCKLYAEKQLGVPWLLHLDVFRDLNPVLRTSARSRPDMVGRRADDNWVAFESKGRVAQPDSKTKTKAKEQSRRVVRVLGRRVTGHYAGISYFNNDTLNLFVQDPPPLEEGDANGINIKGTDDTFFETYYAPFIEFLRSSDSRKAVVPETLSPDIRSAYSAEMDVHIGMRSDIFALASNKRWDALIKVCSEDNGVLKHSGFHSDGIYINCGPTWQKPDNRSFQEVVDDG